MKIKTAYLLMITVLLFCRPAFCDESVFSGAIDLPAAEPDEIKERSTLELFSLEKKYFLKDDYDKERRSFYPDLFPEAVPQKGKYEFFVSKGSFDSSAFGVKTASENEKYYYRVSHTSAKTKGEIDFFESRTRDIILQTGLAFDRMKSRVFSYAGGFEKESGLYDKNTVRGGGGYEWDPFNNFRLHTGFDISKSILRENALWVNNYNRTKLGAKYSPFEYAVIDTEYEVEDEKRRRLDLTESAYRQTGRFSFTNSLSLFDYASVAGGYVRESGRNFSSAKLIIPFGGVIRLEAGYNPGVNFYNFDDYVISGFKYSAFPDIEYAVENSPFYGLMDVRLMGESLIIEAGVRRSKIGNYLVWMPDGEYLSPVFWDSADKREFDLKAEFKTGFVRNSASVKNNILRDNATGSKASGEPAWILSLNSELVTGFLNANIEYKRESSRSFLSGSEEVRAGAYNIVSLGIGRHITDAVMVSLRAENIFSESHADRPVYARKKPNYTIGINILF